MAEENLYKFTDDGFENDVVKSNLPAVVDFWAEWCGPCRMIAPTIKDLSDEYHGKVKVGKLNVDENPKTATKYGIRGIPTLLIFKDGQIIQQMVGVKSKAEIKKVIDSLVS